MYKKINFTKNNITLYIYSYTNFRLMFQVTSTTSLNIFAVMLTKLLKSCRYA